MPRDRAEWITIQVEPIISPTVFEQVQAKLKENQTNKRRQPKRFYLLRGMVICEKCEHVYVAQTQLAGSNRRRVDCQSYRHRMRLGHCHNRTLGGAKLERAVWDTIVEAILKPDNLRASYAEALKRDGKQRERTLAYLADLRKNQARLEQKRDNYSNSYNDPEIPMTKAEYIRLKTQVDGELAGVQAEITQAETKLSQIKAPVDLETFERYTTEIRAALAENVDPSPERKRKVLELLHVKVVIALDGKHEVQGWFTPQANNGKGLLRTTTRCN